MRRWLDRAVPSISASELGFFRVWFGLGLAYVLYDARLPNAPFPETIHSHRAWLVDWPWVHLLAARPDLVAALEVATIAALVIFAAGLATRIAYAAAVAGLFLWTMVLLTHSGAHQWAVALVAAAALLPVHWGDGFSIDALLRRRGGVAGLSSSAAAAPAPGEMEGPGYGFAVWLPGLVLGTAMAGAGIAKLRGSGLEWITSGAVRYHFVIDAANAPVDWGLWIASHPWAAVALSFGAVVVETTMVAAVAIPSYIRRLPFALFAFCLLMGFFLFQAEVWRSWWLLAILFFVPFPAIYRLLAARRGGGPRTATMPLSRAQLAAAVTIVVLQLVASIWRLEVSPLMSDYAMYSNTFASTDEFDRRSPIPPRYHFIGHGPNGLTMYADDHVERLELDGLLRDAAVEHHERGQVAPARLGELQGAFDVLARAEPRLDGITVLADRKTFDWDQGTFVWSLNEPLATLTAGGSAAAHQESFRSR